MSILTRRGAQDTYTRERPGMATGRKWPATSQAEMAQKKPTLLTPRLWTSSLQNCEGMNFCGFWVTWSMVLYNDILRTHRQDATPDWLRVTLLFEPALWAPHPQNETSCVPCLRVARSFPRLEHVFSCCHVIRPWLDMLLVYWSYLSVFLFCVFTCLTCIEIC